MHYLKAFLKISCFLSNFFFLKVNQGQKHPKCFKSLCVRDQALEVFNLTLLKPLNCMFNVYFIDSSLTTFSSAVNLWWEMAGPDNNSSFSNNNFEVWSLKSIPQQVNIQCVLLSFFGLYFLRARPIPSPHLPAHTVGRLDSPALKGQPSGRSQSTSGSVWPVQCSRCACDGSWHSWPLFFHVFD